MLAYQPKHLLTRQVSPERGLVRVGGMDVARLDPEVLAHSVIMLDHPRDSEVSTVGEWLFIESGIEPSTLEMHLQGLRVSHWIESLPDRLNAPLGALWSMAGPLGTNRLKLHVHCPVQADLCGLITGWLVLIHQDGHM